MKHIIFLSFVFLIFFSNQNCFGQESDYYWPLGYASYSPSPLAGGMSLTFPNNVAQLDTHSRPMWFMYTNATISNDTGQLLFYTNGVFVANALDDTMMNGSGLNPSWYTTSFSNTGLRIPQAALIIPKPGDDSLFYLFHSTLDYPTPLARPRFLYLSTINMNGDNGLGDVTQKNHVIIEDTLYDNAFNVCRHANGRDWWLLVQRWGANIGYYTFLVTPDTIQQMNYQTYPFDGLQAGQSCFSPDGSKYIISYWWGVAFFEFDRCSGMLTFIDHKYFGGNIFCLGASISPNSRYAYVTFGGNEILQYDLNASNIVASEQVVATYDGFQAPAGWNTNFWMHQIGPDGKIYINTTSTTMALHTIESPDSAGVACNVQQHSILLPKFNATLPNFPNYRLGALAGSPCDTLTNLNNVQPPDLKFKVFPNPNNGEFQISYQLPQNKQGRLEILDINGKLLWSRNLPAWSTTQKIIMDETIPQGFYLIRLSSDKNIATQKLIIYDN
ncbi:MAG: T9SS type A sorting domain-containing protein [Bacteroidota bacterium]